MSDEELYESYTNVFGEDRFEDLRETLIEEAEVQDEKDHKNGLYGEEL